MYLMNFPNMVQLSNVSQPKLGENLSVIRAKRRKMSIVFGIISKSWKCCENVGLIANTFLSLQSGLHHQSISSTPISGDITHSLHTPSCTLSRSLSICNCITQGCDLELWELMSPENFNINTPPSDEAQFIPN